MTCLVVLSDVRSGRFSSLVVSALDFCVFAHLLTDAALRHRLSVSVRTERVRALGKPMLWVGMDTSAV